MKNYEEIDLEEFREKKVFSFLFMTFPDFHGNLIFTNKLFGFVKVQQQKYKWRMLQFDDGYTFNYFWGDWKYSWRYTKTL